MLQRLLRRQAPLAAAVLASVALFVPAAAQASDTCVNADVAPTAENIDEVRGAVLCLVNEERSARGLSKLTENSKLRVSAARHTTNMVQSRFFEHTTPAGTTMVDRIRKAGYMRGANSWAVGENLAWGTGPLSTATQIQASWMRSAGHKANILRAKYREIGIAIGLGVPVQLSAAQLGATFTTNFGVRNQ